MGSEINYGETILPTIFIGGSLKSIGLIRTDGLRFLGFLPHFEKRGGTDGIVGFKFSHFRRDKIVQPDVHRQRCACRTRLGRTCALPTGHVAEAALGSSSRLRVSGQLERNRSASAVAPGTSRSSLSGASPPSAYPATMCPSTFFRTCLRFSAYGP